jgi:hypothetical protein
MGYALYPGEAYPIYLYYTPHQLLLAGELSRRSAGGMGMGYIYRSKTTVYPFGKDIGELTCNVQEECPRCCNTT